MKNGDFDITTQNLIADMLAQVKFNLSNLEQEWMALQHIISSSVLPQDLLSRQDVIVSKSSLQKMAGEMDQIKMLLPRFLTQSLVVSATKTLELQEECEKLKKERDGLMAEVVHWKNQLEIAVADAQKEKEEHLELQVNIKDLNDQLSQQSEFSFSLGSVCCTLLWRLSRQEDCIQTLVTGSKSSEFLALVSSSVQSYLTAYKDEQWPDKSTDEAAFILALCGTVTNIAASALGREHLASSGQGQAVINTFISFIRDAPAGKTSNIKSLMLMSLYNISINQKGVKFLCCRPGLIAMLCRHLKGENDPESKVNTLRLLQSLLSDETSPYVIHELQENLSLHELQQLAAGPNKDIQDLSLDIIMDIRQMNSQQ